MSKMKMATDGSAIQKRILIGISGNRDAGDAMKWPFQPAEGNFDRLVTVKRKS